LAIATLSDVLVAIPVFWVPVGVLLLLTARFMPAKGPQVACILSGIPLLLFSYSSFYLFIQRVPIIDEYATLSGQIFGWWIFTAIAVSVAAWFIGKLRPVTMFLNYAATGLLLLSAYSIYQARSHPPSLTTREHGIKLKRNAPLPVGKPDIVYIILDGYGRSDQLRRVFGFDNTPFIESLKKTGFVVTDESNSNYVQTELSLASSLNLDFIPNVVKTTADDIDRISLDLAIDDSRASKFLKSLGYSYIGIGSGFPNFHFRAADYAFVERDKMPDFPELLIDQTPFARTKLALASAADRKRIQINQAFANARYILRPAARPRFVVMHVLAPHPPFVFTKDGAPRPLATNYGLWDGNHFYTAGGSLKDYREGYVDQIQYINKRTLELARDVVRSNPNAIIVIQGDHGSKSHLDQDHLSKTDTAEAFGILNAYRVPRQMAKHITPDISPVNTFRLMFRELFGADLEMLENRSYYSSWPLPYRLTEVTAKVSKTD
jgi:hypothetical protein